MMNTKRMVSKLPLTNLWTDEEDLTATRERYLTKDELSEIIAKQPVVFVVATIGAKLNRIPVDNCYEFWKTGVQNHLVANPDDEEGFSLGDFPNGYAYIASQWKSLSATPIIVLKVYH